MPTTKIQQAISALAARAGFVVVAADESPTSEGDPRHGGTGASRPQAMAFMVPPHQRGHFAPHCPDSGLMSWRFAADGGR